MNFPIDETLIRESIIVYIMTGKQSVRLSDLGIDEDEIRTDNKQVRVPERTELKLAVLQELSFGTPSKTSLVGDAVDQFYHDYVVTVEGRQDPLDPGVQDSEEESGGDEQGVKDYM